MRTLLFVNLFIWVSLLGCLDSKVHHYNPPPQSPEEKARERFRGVAQEYQAQGIQISCEKSCAQLGEEQLELLKQKAQGFRRVQRKIAYIKLSTEPKIHFSHPVGAYEMYLPWDSQAAAIEGAILLFERLLQLEDSAGFKVFVSSTEERFHSAVQVLANHHANLKTLGLRNIYLQTGATTYPRSIRMVDINVDDLNASFETIRYRLGLFLEAAQKMPKIELEAVRNEKETYNFIEFLLANSAKMNSAVGAHRLFLLIDGNMKDLFVAGPAWGQQWVSIHPYLSLQELTDLISYQGYLADLGKKLGVNVFNREGLASYSEFPACFSKLPALEIALAAKSSKLKTVLLDYGFVETKEGSRLQGSDLILFCGKETVDQMLDVIEGI